MALVDYTLFGVANKVQEAVAVLKQYEPPEGYYVAFSGGKDSLCIYWLTKIAGVKADYHYNFTTVDPPELVSFVRTFDDVQIHHPGTGNTMFDLIVKNGMPPTSRMRYCCRQLKEGGGKDRVKVLGVREEESARRKGRSVVELDSPLGRVINLIYRWSEIEVWEFIDCNLIEYCKLYDEAGINRLGCVGCPLGGARAMERTFERWPLYKKAYIKAFDNMLEVRKEKGYMDEWQTGEDVMHWWMYRTKTDENQMCLFDREIKAIMDIMEG